jgi:hypothetical protein
VSIKCIVADCEKPRDGKLGYCGMHRCRWLKHGNVDIGRKQPANIPCIAPGCARISVARGYCGRHIQRIYKDLPIEEADSLPARFMRRVNQSDGCWLWTGHLCPQGYGQFSIFGRNVRAHRMAFELYVGYVPSSSLVCHRCDNPTCVRPDHLFLGTHADNIRDMMLKGRSMKGRRHRDSRLAEARRFDSSTPALLRPQI